MAGSQAKKNRHNLAVNACMDRFVFWYLRSGIPYRDVDHLHNLNGTAHKNFITVAKDSDPIFLSVDELMKLYQLKISKSAVLKEWPELCGEKRSGSAWPHVNW